MSAQRERGITLIELMIAMAIAMIILLAISQAYVSSVKIRSAQTDVTRLNETTRFAFDMVTRALRQAGYRNTWQIGSSAQNFCTGGGSNISLMQGADGPDAINYAAADLSGTTVNIANRSDVLRVRYYGEDSTGTSPVLDCQGYNVAASQLVEDTIYVALDSNSVPSLFCYTTNPHPGSTAANPLPMVIGVESMQLLFGVDDDADNVVNRFIPWNAGSPPNPDTVLSVRMSIVARSPNDVATAPAQPTYRHFGAAYNYAGADPATANGDRGATYAVAAADRRIRLLTQTEIALRNYRWCG